MYPTRKRILFEPCSFDARVKESKVVNRVYLKQHYRTPHNSFSSNESFDNGRRRCTGFPIMQNQYWNAYLTPTQSQEFHERCPVKQCDPYSPFFDHMNDTPIQPVRMTPPPIMPPRRYTLQYNHITQRCIRHPESAVDISLDDVQKKLRLGQVMCI